MEKQRKALNIGLIIIGGLGLIGLIIGTFLDKQITHALGNQGSVYGILFTMLTPVLSLAVGSTAGALLFFMPKIENKIADILLRVLGAVAFVAFTGFSIKEGIEYVDFPVMEAKATTYKVLAITLVALIDIGIILFVKLSMKKIESKRIVPTVVTIFVILAAWLFVSEVIKYLASRPRPRNIYLADPIASFRNWYEWQPFFCFKKGMKDCKSFVSGHAFISTCLVSSLPLLLSLSKEKAGIKMTIIGLALAGAFSFVVAFSRIVAYAHFMTDVMGAIFVSCGAQAIILNVAPIIYKKAKSK
jgi:membrane-associated phospholipid phosphatase